MIGRLGLFFERDDEAGLLVYAPESGLYFAVHESLCDTVEHWLVGGEESLPEAIEAVLASAQSRDNRSRAILHGPLLESDRVWDTPPHLSRPLVYNWLITGECPLRCVYCYAQDLMHGAVKEPSAAEIRATAKSILGCRPLTVVLAGGDPLSSPCFELAIEELAGNCAIVVDTNGIQLTRDHMELFAQHRVSVRISLDGETPAIGRHQRPSIDGRDSAPAAFRAICECLDAGVPTAVQSVATRDNISNLHWFGDRLFRLGVRSMRILRVAPSKSRMAGYHRSIGGTTQKAEQEFENKWRNFVRVVLPPRARRWSSSMSVQVTGVELPDSVVLVGPDGHFYTESPSRRQKVLIDDSMPGSPSPMALRKRVELGGHYRRYFCNTGRDLLSFGVTKRTR